MLREIGRIVALYQYPVKSMAGRRLDSAQLGWHGLVGDRRCAFKRTGVTSGFPWLTAGRLPHLIRYTPVWQSPGESGELPTHVRTPAGKELELDSEELRLEVSQAFGSPVELMRLDQGIFDEADVSLITTSTIAAIEQQAELQLDAARFRPNILVETPGLPPFAEDAWIGKALQIGNEAAVHVYLPDVRCAMINLDPENGAANSAVLKAVVKLNANNAGVYGSVLKTGTLAVGDQLFLSELAR